MKIKQFLKDGMIYFKITDENGNVTEESLYDENGNVNESLIQFLNDNKNSVEIMTSKERFANLKGKLQKNKKKVVAIGLTLAIAAGTGMLLSKCSNKPSDTNTSNTKSTKSYSDEELKTIYIDVDTYKLNVKDLAQYLSEYGNKNIKPKDVNSFYYLANMTHIKTSTFNKLVEEGYLPETETDIIIEALGIMDDLRDTVALNGINGKEATVDYSKLFVDARTQKVFEASQNNYNNAVKIISGKGIRNVLEETKSTDVSAKNEKSTKDLLNEIGDFEDKYELGENTLNTDIKEYGTLSAGEQVIYNNIEAKTYDILLAQYGASVGGKARDKRIEDISNLVVSLRKQFACAVVDKTNEKTK